MPLLLSPDPKRHLKKRLQMWISTHLLLQKTHPYLPHCLLLGKIQLIPMGLSSVLGREASTLPPLFPFHAKIIYSLPIPKYRV